MATAQQMGRLALTAATALAWFVSGWATAGRASPRHIRLSVCLSLSGGQLGLGYESWFDPSPRLLVWRHPAYRHTRTGSGAGTRTTFCRSTPLKDSCAHRSSRSLSGPPSRLASAAPALVPRPPSPRQRMPPLRLRPGRHPFRSLSECGAAQPDGTAEGRAATA